MSKEVQLAPSWRQYLLPEFDQDYMKNLKAFLLEQKKAGKVIYPKGDEIFAAFDYVPFDNLKVVIIGQDPYHGPNQAHGLCFSVKPEVPVPPSLQNMYKELQDDLGITPVNHGYLTHWAKQGVLLLNAVLTVEQARAGSHQKRGWEQFTDRVIDLINEQKEHVVFMLWGSYAQKKGERIDRSKHLVLKSVHPSPLSAHRGFFGNKHFSKANDYLTRFGKRPINWQLPAEI